MAIACVPMVLCGAMFVAGLPGFFVSKNTMAETANGAPQAMEGAVEDQCCDCAESVILEIEITTAPGGEVWKIDDADGMQAVLDGIRAFYDDPQTIFGASDVGQAEGMSYSLRVTEGQTTLEYTLFNGGLLTEQGWLVNKACYDALEAIVCKTK